jgi:diacylglycerol kinase family enzyme
MRVRNPDVAFSIIPIGSANDYAFSLDLEHQAAPLRRIDVGIVTAANGKRAFFGCNLGLGFNGHVTWEAQQIRWLQGVALYGLAALRAILRSYRLAEMTIQLDDAPAWTAPTLLFSTLIGKREGGFVLAPRAEVDDGWLDYIHAGDLSRWEIVRFLPRLALFGPPEIHPKIRQGRCQRVAIRSAAPLIVHTDGELFCIPGDQIREIRIEILAGVLGVVRLEGVRG